MADNPENKEEEPQDVPEVVPFQLKLNDEVIFEIKESDMKLLHSYVNEDRCLEEIKVRLQNCMGMLLENAYQSAKHEWFEKLGERWDRVPLKRNDLLDLIFSQPDYKSQKEKQGDSVFVDEMSSLATSDT